MRRSVLAACCLLFAIGFSTSLQAEDPPGFRPIFDGKSLDAWKGDEKFWRVENGVIVGESTPDNPCKANTFLTWAQGDVDDFTLKLEFKLSASDESKANSGIQFRSDALPGGEVEGYQADVGAGWGTRRAPSPPPRVLPRHPAAAPVPASACRRVVRPRSRRTSRRYSAGVHQPSCRRASRRRPRRSRPATTRNSSTRRSHRPRASTGTARSPRPGRCRTRDVPVRTAHCWPRPIPARR